MLQHGLMDGRGMLYLFFIVESFLEVILHGMCSLIPVSAICICRFLSSLFSWLVKTVLYFMIENCKCKIFYSSNFSFLPLLMADVCGTMCLSMILTLALLLFGRINHRLINTLVQK